MSVKDMSLHEGMLARKGNAALAIKLMYVES